MQRIKLSGPIRKYRKIKHPLDKKKSNVFWHLFEMVEEGSPAAPKNLPKASKISFTVILNDRQFNKLTNDLDEYDLKLQKANIYIEGEMTLDLPLDIVEGEIGVIAYEVKSIDASKLKASETQEDVTA